MMARARVSSERGYNLVEVLIAMALLGTVLLSIVTLFVMGRGNVYHGKQMSQAISVATDAMEDMAGLSMTEIRSAFGVDNAATLSTIDVDPNISFPTDEYEKSILRTTKTISSATDPKGYLQAWKNSLAGNARMANSSVNLVFTPLNPHPTTAAVTPGNATVMRVRVVVRWQEGLRWREVVSDTVRTKRP